MYKFKGNFYDNESLFVLQLNWTETNFTNIVPELYQKIL